MSMTKVAVGLSGGVDSAVTAYLLQKEGYEVIGVNFQLLDKQEANHDAKKVADYLNIPFYSLDLRKEFRKEVISYFLNEYDQGRTPNPCVMCNKKIKFTTFLKEAKKLGADKIATGHYAQILYSSQYKQYVLKKGIDPSKDQSYFLYNLEKNILEDILMPLGIYSKDEVRTIAEKININLSRKKDSQEICFIENDDYKSFILENKQGKIEKGLFKDRNGVVLGEHDGIQFYTIGQRKGLGIALGKPVYVIGLEEKTNTVILGEQKELFSNILLSKDNNFILDFNSEKELEVEAKIRYRSKPSKALLRKENNLVQLSFLEEQRAITPGQSVVFYLDDLVLGGGVIL